MNILSYEVSTARGQGHEPVQRADGYRVSWVADGSDREVPIEGELVAYFGGRLRVGGVAGQLLPPNPT